MSENAKNELWRSYGREVIATEAAAIAALADRLDAQFDQAVESILNCSGRVVVTGIGKSGLIGRKISATLNSTGVPSSFLHPAEAVHGDLGLVQSNDVVIAISKSGRLDELDSVLAAAKRLGCTVIALAGSLHSPLAQRSDIVLDCSVAQEACPDIQVPTSSSTAALVMGDALAVALLRHRGFTPDDFAALHPAGALGLRLVKTVADLHHSGANLPIARPDTLMPDLLVEMTAKRLGCVCVVDDAGRIVGIFTDGDLRRVIESGKSLRESRASEVITRNSKTIWEGALVDVALNLMERYAITQLPTVDRDKKLVGVIHLHDILKSKLV